jgi:hypothetical protein
LKAAVGRAAGDPAPEAGCVKRPPEKAIAPGWAADKTRSAAECVKRIARLLTSNVSCM